MNATTQTSAKKVRTRKPKATLGQNVSTDTVPTVAEKITIEYLQDLTPEQKLAIIQNAKEIQDAADALAWEEKQREFAVAFLTEDSAKILELCKGDEKMRAIAYAESFEAGYKDLCVLLVKDTDITNKTGVISRLIGIHGGPVRGVYAWKGDVLHVQYENNTTTTKNIKRTTLSANYGADLHKYLRECLHATVYEKTEKEVKEFNKQVLERAMKLADKAVKGEAGSRAEVHAEKELDHRFKAKVHGKLRRHYVAQPETAKESYIQALRIKDAANKNAKNVKDAEPKMRVKGKAGANLTHDERKATTRAK